MQAAQDVARARGQRQRRLGGTVVVQQLLGQRATNPALTGHHALPDGVTGALVERQCDVIGERLMLAALQGLRDGTLSRRPQPPGGSYQPWPAPDDWRIATSWTARRAFNFMRGTAEWGQPYIVRAGEQQIALATAIAYDPDELLHEAFVHVGDEIWIQFAAGVLRAREL